jgi:hypothetical protein
MNATTDHAITDSLSRQGLDERYAPVIELWTLRILFSLDQLERRLRDRMAEADDSKPPSDAEGTPDADAALDRLLTEMKALRDRHEAASPGLPQDTTLAVNIARLGDRLDLSAVERELLHFVVLQRLCSELTEALKEAGELNRTQTVRLLSI